VDRTQGNVIKVDPQHITENFADIILQTPIIATHVMATMSLHKLLKFRNEE